MLATQNFEVSCRNTSFPIKPDLSSAIRKLLYMLFFLLICRRSRPPGRPA
ncbi:unnamed protein product, partial [Amoebophrya sp. A120]|eukprot:GSA120T00009106001.1